MKNKIQDETTHRIQTFNEWIDKKSTKVTERKPRKPGRNTEA